MPQFPQQWQSRPPADRPASESTPPTAAAPARAQPNVSPGAAPGAVAPISFEPESAARAIVFHMLDEGLAREVTADSVRKTVARLRRRGLRPSIRRSAWRGMTNHERLEWLLSETLTVPLMKPDDDVVSLETRDER